MIELLGAPSDPKNLWPQPPVEVAVHDMTIGERVIDATALGGLLGIGGVAVERRLERCRDPRHTRLMPRASG